MSATRFKPKPQKKPATIVAGFLLEFQLILIEMALDVYLQSRIEAPRSGGDCELVYAFDDDGYYWFLHPLFEQLARVTGEHIDLYGDASFGGTTLDALSQTLAQARQLVESQPPNWEVVTGWTTKPTCAEIRLQVSKQRMIILLSALDGAIEKAKLSASYLTFWGD